MNIGNSIVSYFYHETYKKLPFFIQWSRSFLPFQVTTKEHNTFTLLDLVASGNSQHDRCLLVLAIITIIQQNIENELSFGENYFFFL